MEILDLETMEMEILDLEIIDINGDRDFDNDNDYYRYKIEKKTIIFVFFEINKKF
jgi:hypothetical protein